MGASELNVHLNRILVIKARSGRLQHIFCYVLYRPKMFIVNSMKYASHTSYTTNPVSTRLICIGTAMALVDHAAG